MRRNGVLNMKVVRNSKRGCMLLILSFALGCNASNEDLGINHMESSEKTFNEQQSKAVLAYMSLEDMFPDQQVRELAAAAGNGKIKHLEQLVSQGVSVNSRGLQNATPLFWAMKSDNAKGFQKLLELGADPNVVFGDGGTVMHWAARNENPEFLNLALQHGGNTELAAGQFMQTPIFETIGIFGEIGNTPSLKILLGAGANVNAKANNGDTPVIVAARLGRFDIVFELLSKGADPTVTNNGQDLVSLIAAKRKTLAPAHELYRWLERVDEKLRSAGFQSDR